MINAISSISPKDEDYYNVCKSALKSALNYWFDPIIPSPVLTLGDMCDAYNEMF
jgi:hypothetical protein